MTAPPPFSQLTPLGMQKGPLSGAVAPDGLPGRRCWAAPAGTPVQAGDRGSGVQTDGAVPRVGTGAGDLQTSTPPTPPRTILDCQFAVYATS